MPIVLPSEPSMPPQMLTTFLLAFLVFAVLCLAFIRVRYRVGELRDFAAETIT